MFFIKILAFLAVCSQAQSLELKGLQLLINLISGEFMETKKPEPEPASPVPVVSRGSTNYNFLDFVTFPGKQICDANDPNKTLNQFQRTEGKRPPIKVKCLRGRGNSTVHVVRNMQEALIVLAPHGNSTKRSVEGNCTLILFYTQSCLASVLVAPHYNALARQFPDMKIAAIDAFKFYSFNTEFGIVGLPTIMLFHQGRPIIKFNDSTANVNHFGKFITRHTDFLPVINPPYVKSQDFMGPLPCELEQKPDFYLYLAWAFILVCAGYYFTKSKFYVQIVEVIKRNWQESEAQLGEGS